MRKIEQGAIATSDLLQKALCSSTFLMCCIRPPLRLTIQSHRQSHQTPKMTSPKPSITDEKPNLESYYRKLSLLATAALAVHISWPSASPSDFFVPWLVSAVPKMLTQFFLIGLLVFALFYASETRLFTTIETSARSERAGFRTSSNPDREDRHFFDLQVILHTPRALVSRKI